MSRQIGKIRISAELIENGDIRVLDMFKSIGFIPSAVDRFNTYDEYIYTGYSSHFQPLTIGEQIPFYNVILNSAAVTLEV